MKKISLFMVLSLILTFIIPFSVFAEQDHFLKVRLISGYFETEYDKNNVIVNYEKTDYSIKATIIDKKTNKVLEIFSEKTDLPISKIQQMKSSKFSVKGTPSTYDTTLDKTQPLDNSPLGAAAYTWARVQMTADFSWAQVNKVYSYGHSAGSSGSYHLTGNQSFLGTTTFPTRRFNIDINGII
ncbi:hypothetical protein, partial [Sporanaerobacter acetigenes]|uniref:hypothetical protein n=1 Tax=Sporanaerobacter acetigenes TaxID=165813 RepID=UPI003324B7EF